MYKNVFLTKIFIANGNFVGFLEFIIHEFPKKMEWGALDVILIEFKVLKKILIYYKIPKKTLI